MTKKKKKTAAAVKTSTAPPETMNAAAQKDHTSDPAIDADAKIDGLRKLEIETVESMKTALERVRELSKERLDAKQSVSRIMGVARELKELIKVMSVYGC